MSTNESAGIEVHCSSEPYFVFAESPEIADARVDETSFSNIPPLFQVNETNKTHLFHVQIFNIKPLITKICNMQVYHFPDCTN